MIILNLWENIINRIQGRSETILHITHIYLININQNSDQVKNVTTIVLTCVFDKTVSLINYGFIYRQLPKAIQLVGLKLCHEFYNI